MDNDVETMNPEAPIDIQALREKCLELAVDVFNRSWSGSNHEADKLQTNVVTIAKGFENYILGK